MAARLFKSYLQSDFGSGHKNFEAVVLEGRDLWHWMRDNIEPGKPWKRRQRIVDSRAAFPASMIQSDFKSGAHGDFEVVVPLFTAGGAVELWHIWHDNSDRRRPWRLGQRITEPGRHVIGPASIIQSDFTLDHHGRFEVVVPVVGNNRRTELRHYYNNNSELNKPWPSGRRINDPRHVVIGGGCIIQSNLGRGRHGNFEVAAWVSIRGRSVLQHYWHDNSDINSPWLNGQVIAHDVKGNGVMIQSTFGSPHGNFEVVVPVAGPGGRTYLQHVRHDNSDVNLPWTLRQVITEVASTDASACIFQSDYRMEEQEHGNFEVLVDECRQSLVAYWHSNKEDFAGLPWIRQAVLIGEPANREIRSTVRICQLTGEFDRTGWKGNGATPVAFNQTVSRFGIRGTDLGVSFKHKDRVYFLFGDTWRVGETLEQHSDADAIAFCTDTRVAGGLRLTFNGQPPRVRGISQAGFEVPMDGFSHQDKMFVFFSTNHVNFTDETDQRLRFEAHLVLRLWLAVSENDGHDFRPLVSFSGNKFINVSVEGAFLTSVQARILRWTEGTEVLWIWGAGRYRGTPVYLAVVDLESLLSAITARGPTPLVDVAEINGERGPVRYFAGTADTVLWSSEENDAVSLFCAGDVGELSGRHNSIFNRYFLTYNSGNPRGITLRHAPQPWGPWSEGITIFDPWWGRGPNQPGAGYGKFIHVPWNIERLDSVQDNMFRKGRRDNEWGAEYGPYQIPQFTEGIPNHVCDLYYTMSTWNPYQAVLMRTQIWREDLFG